MRDIKQCHPELQAKAALLEKKCRDQGLIIKITECFRTVKEQDDLYAQGRTKPGKIVTNARGSTYSSMHMWGVAFDICRNDGKGAYNTSGGFFDKVGKIGQSIGLEWGGSWKSIVDKPHFQLPDWGSTTSRLKALYGTPDKFRKTWKASVTPTHTIIKPPSYKVGKVYKLLCDRKVYPKPSINSDPLNHKQLTEGQQAKDANKDGTIDKGRKITCKGVIKKANGSIWIKILSGYILAYSATSKKVCVK